LTPGSFSTETLPVERGSQPGGTERDDPLTEPDIVGDVQAFFAEHDIPQNHLMLLQALERQRVFAALRQRAAPELTERFRD